MLRARSPAAGFMKSMRPQMLAEGLSWQRGSVHGACPLALWSPIASKTFPDSAWHRQPSVWGCLRDPASPFELPLAWRGACGGGLRSPRAAACVPWEGLLFHPQLLPGCSSSLFRCLPGPRLHFCSTVLASMSHG